MDRAALLIPEFLTGMTIGGPLVADHLKRLCREAGLEAEVRAPGEARGDGPLVVLDARYPAISAASIWKLANALREDGGVLLTSDGGVIGAALRGGDPEATLARAFELARHGAATVADANEAVLVEDCWSLARAERAVNERHVADLARAGVRFMDPWRVVVETTVRMAPGCTIWPDVVLRGDTVLDEGVVVQSGAWLEDTRVGPRSVIKAHSVCEGAHIGADCSVGPMAHLRTGADLDVEVKVGNFVEIKKTRLHRGAKASHLTYLGDAEIGAETNIGAGTITCNYDGYLKHRTTVGARAFIGTNSSLVAPVTIGDGAFVAAGSVVSGDVPAEGLAISRAPFVIKEGKGREIDERNRKRAEERKT